MSKTSNMVYKILVFGVIALFIGVSSNSLSINVNTNIENELRENSKIGGADDYKEIITIINADVWEVKGKGRAFIWSDVEIIARSGEPFEIWGIKQPNGNGLFFREKVEYLKAPFIIGLIFSQPPNFASANGVAYGNIEWS